MSSSQEGLPTTLNRGKRGVHWTEVARRLAKDVDFMAVAREHKQERSLLQNDRARLGHKAKSAWRSI